VAPSNENSQATAVVLWRIGMVLLLLINPGIVKEEKGTCADQQAKHLGDAIQTPCSI
jgi:hypothetical protein